ncbi:MAG: ATP-binding protein [Desulfobulbus sp.]|nr:ATP-binding protein [Desulfobulbus sp.]
MKKFLRFSIIAKITLVLFFYIASVTTMGVVSYNDLVATEKKTEILELAYNVHNNIIESRRYEKNYFLYGNVDSLYSTITMIQKASEIIDAILHHDGELAITPKLQELDTNMGVYTKKIYELLALKETDPEKYAQTTGEIRQYGKKISEMSDDIVNDEKTLIHSMIALLREQLVVWSSVAIFIGIILSLLIVNFVFKPLTAVKRATEAIAQGRFQRIEITNSKDELQQVMEACNVMVQELERRQNQLIQAEKLSSLGTLTAGVAHQLNNPLNNISTSCQIAIDEFDAGDTPLLKRMLRNIDQETLRARDVVKSLLDFARTQDFTLRQASLADIVHKAVLLAKSQVPPDIGVMIHIPDNLVLTVDAQQMQEVFINMIINAAQAIERQGEVVIAATVDDANQEAVIEIRDTGQGILEKNLAKVFDPFFTTKEEGQGTGLGLSVVYGIIQQHQGNITVQSTPGQGTSFFIRLPYPGSKEH